ncbi:ABC transporter permease [Chryseotalea sanaruensis]|uniref:ABC transporter permease n=1 Tax=Chryseotalea sanaruensis TaxID=2482724 RepID=A0A401U723_9BACT|nr:ABC transporter permease [Chryseotalea sanaruensis]GCC50679.1 ABC transporter permease [Chryseotalea sanaruensis]
MKVNKESSPPKWATRLLAWYCKPDLLEDLEGDLYEYFLRNVEQKGLRKAKLIYIIDVFKFFRLYTVRKPEFINYLINWIMLGSYIKTSGRSLVRNKLFSTINIAGLAISMTVGLLLIGVLMDVFSYDRFHEKHDQIYRVISRYQYLEHQDRSFMATNSLRAAKAIEESFTGHEGVAILRRGLAGDVQFGEKAVPLSGYWANNSLLSVFSFPLAEGNPATALKEPFSLVLTQTAAHKIFGDESVLGKTILLNDDKEYTITGVLQDLPAFSHMKFEMLCSINTLPISAPERAKSDEAWDNVWSHWVYVVIPDERNLTAFNENLDKLSAKEDLTVKNTHIELALQPLDDIMLGNNMGNEIGPTLGTTILWVFLALCIIVMLSACFNYTNLSIARSLRRSKEVGIRKVIGAVRGHVIAQFTTEAIVLSLLSLVAAYVLFLFVKPHFISMEPDLQKILVLETSPLLILYFFAFAIFIGLVAGIFPAMFFARLNAISVLKSSSQKIFSKVTMRKALIVFQYAISLMLITGTLVIYKQYKHFVNYDLGYTTNNILNIAVSDNNASLLKNELVALNEVEDISRSAMVLGVGNYWSTRMKNPVKPMDSANVWFMSVDDKYLPLHNYRLLAGRNFTPLAPDAAESEVIINEHVIKRLELVKGDFIDALGKEILVDGKALTIVGIIDDFEYGRANNNNNREVLLRYSPKDCQYLNIKLASASSPALIAKIDSIWKKIDPVHPLQAKLYDDEIKEAFSGLSASVKVAGAIAFLTICIASMGMLGMVVFTTETRIKEVSVRKVLGASVARLLLLLGKGFFALIGIAVVIALPITYLFFEEILLPKVANHAPIGLFDMLVGVLAVGLLAMLLVFSQTLKVANANPAEVLKNE